MAAKFFEQLSSDLNELLKNNDEYNVIIEVGQAPNIQAFKVHSIILKSRCLYFKDKLKSMTYNDKNVKIMKQTNISIEVFNIIIKYIYSGTISLENINTSVVFELLIASNEFGLEELIKHIQLFLLENNVSWLYNNFSRVLQASFKDNNLKDLQQFCANIIAKHPKIIFHSNEFLTLSESILIFILKLDDLQIDGGKIWEYTIKWGIAQNPSLPPNLEQWSDEHFSALKRSLQNCLPLIRYFQISSEDVDKVRPYKKILDSTSWTEIQKLKPITSHVDLDSITIANNNALETESNKAESLEIESNKAKSLEIEPNNSFTMKQCEVTYSIDKEKRFSELLTIPDDSLEIEQTNVITIKYRGKNYYCMNIDEESLKDLIKATKIEQNNGIALKYRGKTYIMMDGYDESLDNTLALKIRRNTYRLTRDYDESPTDLNKPLDGANALKIRGCTNRMMGKYEESLKDLNKSLEIEPNDTFTLKNRGESYRMMSRYEESLVDLSKSLKIKPNDALALKIRGDTYRLMNKYEESIIDLNKSLRIKPNDALTLKFRGSTYRMMGKYEESLEDLNKSLKIKPNDAFTLKSRGETYRMMRRYEESLADLNKSLEIKPDDAFVLKVRGDIYRLMGRYEESLVDLNKSLEIEPNDGFALRTRGDTYRLIDRYEESLIDLNKSLEIEPDNEIALNLRGIIDPYNEWVLDQRK
ncbi:hypothetical protein C2G38_2143597 [Gigaspora rosea]|uniref:BTB domain-containing protein n=1 Tax=Gigaspora rosea TaxID=44941 RepID=A0A397V0F6_9GLOM|nr:hypothetical protein C2G38_2143597 [Gigaspora rosea]